MGKRKKNLAQKRAAAKNQLLKEEREKIERLNAELQGRTANIAMMNPVITVTGIFIFAYTIIALKSVSLSSEITQTTFVIIAAIVFLKHMATEMLHEHYPIKSEEDVKAFKRSITIRTTLNMVFLGVCSYPYLSSQETRSKVDLLIEEIGIFISSETKTFLLDAFSYVAAGLSGWLGAIILGILANIIYGKFFK
ncbi:MAG: hypothetical protein AAF669_07320 [Pseudomonadota bacterium]